MNDQNELEKNIIASFKQDEAMMILVFAQWCVNADLDPKTLYLEAYPQQEEKCRVKPSARTNRFKRRI